MQDLQIRLEPSYPVPIDIDESIRSPQTESLHPMTPVLRSLNYADCFKRTNSVALPEPTGLISPPNDLSNPNHNADSLFASLPRDNLPKNLAIPLPPLASPPRLGERRHTLNVTIPLPTIIEDPPTYSALNMHTENNPTVIEEKVEQTLQVQQTKPAETVLLQIPKKDISMPVVLVTPPRPAEDSIVRTTITRPGITITVTPYREPDVLGEHNMSSGSFSSPNVESPTQRTIAGDNLADGQPDGPNLLGSNSQQPPNPNQTLTPGQDIKEAILKRRHTLIRMKSNNLYSSSLHSSPEASKEDLDRLSPMHGYIPTPPIGSFRNVDQPPEVDSSPATKEFKFRVQQESSIKGESSPGLRPPNAQTPIQQPKFVVTSLHDKMGFSSPAKRKSHMPNTTLQEPEGTPTFYKQSSIEVNSLKSLSISRKASQKIPEYKEYKPISMPEGDHFFLDWILYMYLDQLDKQKRLDELHKLEQIKDITSASASAKTSEILKYIHEVLTVQVHYFDPLIKSCQQTLRDAFTTINYYLLYEPGAKEFKQLQDNIVKFCAMLKAKKYPAKELREIISESLSPVCLPLLRKLGLVERAGEAELLWGDFMGRCEGNDQLYKAYPPELRGRRTWVGLRWGTFSIFRTVYSQRQVIYWDWKPGKLFFSSEGHFDIRVSEDPNEPLVNCSNGDFYDGEVGLWSGVPHGNGKFHSKQGRVVIGQWNYGYFKNPET